MLNDVLVQALQEQLTRERQNEANYRAKSAQAEAANYPGVAAWLKKSADDERHHGEMIADYLINQNIVPVYNELLMIDTLPGDDLVGIFQDALELERKTTAAIRELYFLAEQQEDPQTVSFLMVPRGDFPGYLEEQTQSEREIADILQILRRTDRNGWLTFDLSLTD
jgi:ferritin